MMKKTAGRKSLPAATKVGPEFVGKTPEADAQQEAALRERMENAVQMFGGGLPWHLDHYEAQIRVAYRQGCEWFFRAGCYLVVARECASHGEWQGMLDRLGLSQAHAWRMMEAAKRLVALGKTNSDASDQIIRPANDLAAGQRLLKAAGTESKLVELLSLPEDQFQELAQAGEIEGLSLDNLEKMTRNELREALRELRQDKAALDERNAKLQQQAEKAELAAAKAKRAWKEAGPDEQLAQLRRELDAEALRLSVGIISQDADVSSLRKRVEALIAHGEQHNQDHKVYLAGVFAQLERYLHQVRDEFYIPHLAVGDPELEANAMLAPAAGSNKKK